MPGVGAFWKQCAGPASKNLCDHTVYNFHHLVMHTEPWLSRCTNGGVNLKARLQPLPQYTPISHLRADDATSLQVPVPSGCYDYLRAIDGYAKCCGDPQVLLRAQPISVCTPSTQTPTLNCRGKGFPALQDCVLSIVKGHLGTI